MQFTDYQDFRITFIRMAEGDDVSGASFSTATADVMIGLGESRVYRDLRASCMVAPLSQAVTSNAASLPADLIELKELYFDGERPLEVVDLDRLRRYVADGYSSGNARFAAQNGDALVFWPEASGTVLGSYYKRPAAMKDETDWVSQKALARYPECFLYAALTECAEFLGLRQKQQVWDQMYMRHMQNARADENARVWGGSPLRVRAR